MTGNNDMKIAFICEGIAGGGLIYVSDRRREAEKHMLTDGGDGICICGCKRR